MASVLTKGKAILILASVLTTAVSVSAQQSLTRQPDPPVTYLDSTRKEDGLLGSVRRVKTESAKLESKKGKLIEGPLHLLEVTSYDLAGKRVDNVSYPVPTPTVGKEEYKYDDNGNVIELTQRDKDGTLLSKQRYQYEFDKFGNWAKMVTYLVIFEAGEVKTEPVEVTYRTLTYYFDDTVDRVVNQKSGQANSRPLTARAAVPVNRGSNVPPKAESEKEPVAAKLTPARLPANPGTVNRDASLTGASPRVEVPAQPEPKAVTKDTEVAKRVTGQSESQVKPSSVSPNPTSIVGDKVSAAIKTESPATLNKKAFDYYKQGHTLVESGDLKGAIDAYRKSIELGEDSAELQLSLGNVYLKLKKDEDAIRALKQSIRFDPQRAEAYYGLGLLYFRANRFKDAETNFKKATVLGPEMAKAHYGLALTYQELGRHDALIEVYRKLQSLDKNLADQLSKSFPEFNLPCRIAQCK